jgi:putative transposase
MKKKRFTETQIVSILHQQEVRKSVKEISREHGISDATFRIGRRSMEVWNLVM